jgi:hypothetical protein
MMRFTATRSGELDFLMQAQSGAAARFERRSTVCSQWLGITH